MFNEYKILELFISNIRDYYCINSKHKNLAISYLPNIGEFYFTVSANIYKKSNYIPEDILYVIITEQNLIEHYNRK